MNISDEQLKIAEVRYGGDFQTIKFENGSEVYGSSEQDDKGDWIDNRAITALTAALGSVPAPEDDEREALGRLIAADDEWWSHEWTDHTGYLERADAILAAGFRRGPVPADTPSEDEPTWRHDTGFTSKSPRHNDLTCTEDCSATRVVTARPTPPEDVAALDAWWLVAKHIEEQPEGGPLDRAMNAIHAALAAVPADGETETEVTTLYELGQLRPGTVVRSALGTIACRYDVARGTVFGDERAFNWERLALPARVLYRPIPESEEQ